jgi:hypothetical protein
LKTRKGGMRVDNRIRLLDLQKTLVHITHKYGYAEGILEKHGPYFKVFTMKGEGDQSFVSFRVEDIRQLTQNNISLKD